MFARSGYAEESLLNGIDLAAIDQTASLAGFDGRRLLYTLLAGDVSEAVENLPELFARAARNAAAEMCRVLPLLMVPVLICLALRLILKSGGSMAQFVCRAGCIAILASVYSEIAAETLAAMEKIRNCADVFTPMLIALSAASGSGTAVLTPFSGIVADLMENALGKTGIACCTTAACVAIAGNLSEKIRLKRLFELIRQILRWGIGTMMAGFTALLSIQGRLGAGRDSAVLRTAKYAVESVIPVVGSNVTESLGTLLSAGTVVRNAVGSCGLILLGILGLQPVIGIAGNVLMLKFCSAIAEPLGDDAMAGLFRQFAEVTEMLAVILVSGLALCGLLVAGCMISVGGTIR